MSHSKPAEVAARLPGFSRWPRGAPCNLENVRSEPANQCVARLNVSFGERFRYRFGTFVMQKVLAHMVTNKTRGSVINMASQAGRRGEALVSHYCATKAAIISYTQSAALAMASHHIRVNGIAPGVIATPMWKHVDALFAKYENLPLGEKKKQVGLAVPLGYMGDPTDICGAAIFLASDEASYITAQTLNVDGGNVMS